MGYLSDTHQTCLLFEPDELQYDFGPHHPMRSQRLQALIELLEASGLWDPECRETRLAARAASLEELQRIHTPEYIEAVQRLSRCDAQGQVEYCQLAECYGLAPGDTPAFPGMHEAAAVITGGTLVALRTVMGLPQGGQFTGEGSRPRHVFHPAGGWHHAQADHASGFCVYNDLAVGLAHVLQACEAKIAYIDFDAHHGDGVQNAFYDEPRIMTISLHETGRTLFPGTGDVLEVGEAIPSIFPWSHSRTMIPILRS